LDVKLVLLFVPQGDLDMLSQVARTDRTSTAAPQAAFAPISARSGKFTIEEIAEEPIMQRVRQTTTLAAVVLMSLAVALAGCGGRSQVSTPPPSLNPAAVLSSLSPSSVMAEGNGFSLSLRGSNFSSSTTVLWNGQPVPTTFVNSQQVTATISASLIAAAGVVSVAALNANSTESNVLQFTINNPSPQISSISPNNAMAGAAPVVVTVNGSSFSVGATVLVDGSPRSTYAKSITQLSATLPASDLATARSMAITVEDTDLATGPSNSLPFTVTPLTSNPTPTLASSSDTSVPTGWPGFPLTVHGTNFVAASVLQWNGVTRQTTVVSSTELKAAIPAALLAAPEAAQIAVLNPSPGGGTSSSLPIQVEAVSPGAVGVIERSDIGNDLSEPDGTTQSAVVSADGRFVAFVSFADNLAPNTPDINGNPNLFLRDTCIGAPTSCVPSVTLLPSTPDGIFSYEPAMSANGRFVGYSSGTSFLLTDTCVAALAGCVAATQPIDVPANGDVGQISLSADGRFAAYLSGLLSCSPWDYGCSPPEGQVFLADTCAGVASGCTPTSRPITPSEVPADETDAMGGLVHPSISPDGRFVAFNSSHSDIWLYDSCQGAPSSCSPSKTTVSVASDGSAANGDSFGASVSVGGRYVVFLSLASNLVPGLPQPGALRVYFRDMCTGVPSDCTPATTSVSFAGDGILADDPSISADGRYIAFASGAADLVPGDTNGNVDIFAHDTCAGVLSGCTPSTTRVSVALDGTQGTAPATQPVISADGHFVVFLSQAKLAPGANDVGNEVYLARH